MDFIFEAVVIETEQGVEKLEYLLITHPHKDHILRELMATAKSRQQENNRETIALTLRTANSSACPMGQAFHRLTCFQEERVSTTSRTIRTLWDG